MARRGRRRNLEKERLYWDLLASGVAAPSIWVARVVGSGLQRTWRALSSAVSRCAIAKLVSVATHIAFWRRRVVTREAVRGIVALSTMVRPFSECRVAKSLRAGEHSMGSSADVQITRLAPFPPCSGRMGSSERGLTWPSI